MKTIKVNATSYTTPMTEVENGNAIIEIHYAYQGSFGIETTRENMQGFAPCVRCEVVVSAMFPGTHGEWSNHIDSCIIDSLKSESLVKTTKEGIDVLINI